MVNESRAMLASRARALAKIAVAANRASVGVK
jgi:hypothetical protein